MYCCVFLYTTFTLVSLSFNLLLHIVITRTQQSISMHKTTYFSNSMLAHSKHIVVLVHKRNAKHNQIFVIKVVFETRDGLTFDSFSATAWTSSCCLLCCSLINNNCCS